MPHQVEAGKPPAVTDNGNYIVDVEFKTPIKDVAAAAKALKNTVGVVDHGLFVGMTYREPLLRAGNLWFVLGEGWEARFWLLPSHCLGIGQANAGHWRTQSGKTLLDLAIVLTC